MTMKTKLVGKRVYVVDKESIYYGEWGTVADFDGELYHGKIANGSDTMPVFDRKQLYVPRQKVLQEKD